MCSKSWAVLDFRPTGALVAQIKNLRISWQTPAKRLKGWIKSFHGHNVQNCNSSSHIARKKTLLFDLYHDPVKGVLRLYTNQVYHDHVISTRRECMRQIFRGQGWGGQGESSRPPPTIWVEMMEMTIISIMVEEEVDVKQLSSLRKMFLIKMSLK